MLAIALFYTLSAIHGQLGDRAKFDNHGYVAGDYRKSLLLNPKNENAVQMLRKLGAPSRF